MMAAFASSRRFGRLSVLRPCAARVFSAQPATQLTASLPGRLRAALAALLLPIAALATLAAPPASAQGKDPLGSPQWPAIWRDVLGGEAVVFDSRVKVSGPAFAEDAMHVPIAFDASALGQVRRIVVAVDRNPIRKVLEFEPGALRPALTFRFKQEQASPVRVAAQTEDGVWHVGGVLVNAAGGGCTVPGDTRRDGSWETTLNRVEARVFPGRAPGTARLRLRVMHPMDTGLVAGIPAFHIERLAIGEPGAAPLAVLRLYEPVSENPVFSLDLPAWPRAGTMVTGQDNNGNRIAARVAL